MARYEHLNVYKKSYDFNLYFFKLSKGFTKDYKYGMAQEIKEQALRLTDQIILANNSGDKLHDLSTAEHCLAMIKIRVRMLYDLKIIKTTNYEFISRSLIDITNQISAWKKWCEKAGARAS